MTTLKQLKAILQPGTRLACITFAGKKPSNYMAQARTITKANSVGIELTGDDGSGKQLASWLDWPKAGNFTLDGRILTIKRFNQGTFEQGNTITYEVIQNV